MKKTNVFWCETCNVPLLKHECENCGSNGKLICSDLKPMFNKEVKLLEKLLKRKLPGEDWRDGLWMRYRTMWFQGKRFLHLSVEKTTRQLIISKDYSDKISTDISSKKVTSNLLLRANRSTIDKLEAEAVVFIRKIIGKYHRRKPVVSVSGGKDSTVVAAIVKKTFPHRTVPHIFGNTSMEYPDTIRYLKRIYNNHIKHQLITTRSSKNFFQMCEMLGPPSRLNAWCCSVFKASPIADVINKINGEQGVISFEGIRRQESNRRTNRDRIYRNKKIVHQISAYPIIDWKQIDVWLYILTKRLDFNDAYKKGFSRVGCLYCPNNVSYNEFLIKYYYWTKYIKWDKFLLDFATEMKKPDPKDYVYSGAWKTRIGAVQGKSSAYLEKRNCTDGDNITNYLLKIQPSRKEIQERFKPLGEIERINDPIGFSYLVKDYQSNQPLFIFQGVKGFPRLRITVLVNKGRKRLLATIERTIRRLQACVLCGACGGICPTDAIKINLHFKIYDDKCTHCGRCNATKYLRDSCISLHSNQQTTKYRIQAISQKD